MSELRDKIAQLLVEPEIGMMDWNLGKGIIANWKAGLPDRILALLSLPLQPEADVERVKKILVDYAMDAHNGKCPNLDKAAQEIVALFP